MKRIQDELEGIIAGGDVHLLGPNTNLNVFEEFRDDLEGRPSRSSRSRATRAARCSRARRSASGSRTGRRPATRWTSSSPTSSATSPTSPRAGVIAVLHRGLQERAHADARGRRAAKRASPIVMVKVGKTEAGTRWPSRTPATSPAPTRSSARCSASSASRGSAASTSCSRCRPRWRAPAALAEGSAA